MKKVPIYPDPKRKQKLAAFDRLLTIMDQLRNLCPWDKNQTIESIRHLTIEETYELSDAILDNDLVEVKKELGDLMLHMVFYAKMGEEKGAFDMADILNGIAEKLIYRHPHIYADEKVDDEKTVLENWEKLKLKEKGNKSVLGGVPKSLPALIKAQRIQEKARGVGFDWDKKSQVWDKVEEEIAEFKQEEQAGNKEKATEEFGDLLFSLINYARFNKINPEEALERTNKKFIKRFQHLEKASKADGKTLSEMTLEEMDTYWNAAKKL